VDAPLTAKAELFGLKIHNVTFAEAVALVIRWTREIGAGTRYVLTPNINHLVLHQHDAAFRNAYESAALVVPDGRYIVLLGRLMGQNTLETINGSDLVPAIFDEYEGPDRLRVYLLGAMPGVAERASANIEARWPAIEIVGTYSPPFGFEKNDQESESIVGQVNESKPDLLIVGISPPKQEIWISRYSKSIQARVSICAGATIDFMAGEKTRAPRWMQKAGMEWLFRMLSEPRRLTSRYFGDAFAILRLLCSEMWQRLKMRISGRGRTKDG